MRIEKMMKINLQFFGENSDGENTDNDTTGSSADDSNNNSTEVDMQAFADILSEKDNQIKELQKDVAELKKLNANLTIMVNSDKTTTVKRSFEENLLNMVGAKPRKE